jgi:hypothetical protein
VQVKAEVQAEIEEAARADVEPSPFEVVPDALPGDGSDQVCSVRTFSEDFTCFAGCTPILGGTSFLGA